MSRRRLPQEISMPLKTEKPASARHAKRPAKPGSGQTKKARLEQLLSRPRGAAPAQLEKALGWQPHTVRAAISRLRKSGAEVTLDRSGRTPAYRIGSAA